MDNKLEKKSMLIIVTELLFAIMPLLILLLISLLTSQSLLAVFKRSDISFISVILFGQASVRFISGYVNKGNKFGWQRIAFLLTCLFIFGLVPSVVYLIIVHSEISKTQIVYILQNIWLLLSVIAYIILGCIGQIKLDE
ncbi:MAG: hypothetical protein LBT04_03355 [Prevotellaceae bacterium]|jgi:hypothetical protein|nr:hypothetical protein [Prevotellaceae bacterium]